MHMTALHPMLRMLCAPQDAEDALPEEFNHMSAEAISQRARLLDNEIRVSSSQ